MKKSYEKPSVKIVSFDLEKMIMAEPEIGENPIGSIDQGVDDEW